MRFFYFSEMTISEIYKLYKQHYLVDTDTRKIRKNSIFFALKGENFNGNKFAKEALKNGASYAVVDEIEAKTQDNIILVENVLACLQDLARFHRDRLQIPILGLTGSNGKTTTKELINSVLSTKYKTIATQGNLNNHIGVPLTLLSMTDKTEIGIVEMGANHLKEIELLCKIANPNYGCITNFGKAHLEGFGSINGVIEGKTELYKYIRKNKGKIFINQNDKTQIEKSKEIQTIQFEESIKFVSANPNVKLTYKNFELNSHLIGTYNYPNIAAAITIGNYFNIDSTKIKSAIESYIPSNNRSQVITRKSFQIILDAYNANPTSMKAAIDNLNNLNVKHKVAILGDMFELGKNTIEEHQIIIDYIEQTSIDKIIIIGNIFGKTNTQRCIHFTDFNHFKSTFNYNDFKNSTILIKGSRGMKMERIVDLL